jgi:hypothetical protein
MQSLRNAARACLRSLQQQQTRTYKDLPVKKNPHVEEWYNAREDMEMTAEITPGMVAQGAFWGLVVPFFTYELIVAEFRASDEQKQRKLLLFPDSVEFEGSATSEEE